LASAADIFAPPALFECKRCKVARIFAVLPVLEYYNTGAYTMVLVYSAPLGDVSKHRCVDPDSVHLKCVSYVFLCFCVNIYRAVQ
jgi:hypothetical protein